MRQVRPDPAWLRGWLEREEPGPDAIAGHMLTTGHGRCWVDDPRRPRAVLVESAGNYLLGGEPAAVGPADLRPLITGFVAAPPDFAPVLSAAFPLMGRWDRVIYRGPEPTGASATPPVRPLVPADTGALTGLHPEMTWIAKTWGGPTGLAASGYAWGAFVDGRPVAVAATFFAGMRYHEVGVVTEPGYQGRGLATACAANLCRQVAAAGRRPSWSTSVDNLASRRVAEKLGFIEDRRDVLYVINTEVP